MFFFITMDPLNDGSNPVVFFDVAMGNHPIGRIKMELFADVVPKTAENFRCVLEFLPVLQLNHV